MKYQFIVFSIIFSISILVPSAFAQIVGGNSLQDSVKVEIDAPGKVHVTHEIKKQSQPQQLDLLKGTITNLKVIDLDGNEAQFGTINENRIMILPTNEKLIVEYDLSDALVLQENVWTWNVLYLQSTSFIFPEEVDMIFVNNKPVKLGDKPGIMCHGCQMKLEYSLNEPRLTKMVTNQDDEYPIEVMTWAKINQFDFSKEKGISFQTEGENDFITVIVPKNFLIEPYEVLFNDEKIFFHKYIENGTHVWLSLRPEGSGEVTILGTIIPDFSSEDYDSFPLEYAIGVGIAIAVTVVVLLIKKKK